MGAVSIADDNPKLCDELSLAQVANPFAGPLFKAAESVLKIYDGEFGISDEHYLPVIEARRILYGSHDGFVAAFDMNRFAASITPANETLPEVETTEVSLYGSSGASHLETAVIPQKVFSVALSDPEIQAGLRVLGKLMRTSESDKANAPVALDVGIKYMKMEAWGERYDVRISTVKRWRRLGLPTNGIKGRGVRVKVPEADDWVDAGGPKLALAAAGARHARRGGK
jgi:hypothetical protein